MHKKFAWIGYYWGNSRIILLFYNTKGALMSSGKLDFLEPQFIEVSIFRFQIVHGHYQIFLLRISRVCFSPGIGITKMNLDQFEFSHHFPPLKLDPHGKKARKFKLIKIHFGDFHDCI